MNSYLQLFHSDSDTPAVSYRKRITLICIPFAMVLGIPIVLGFENRNIMYYACVVFCFCYIIATVKWIVTKVQTENELTIILVVSIATIIAGDILNSSETGAQIWPLSVIVLDVVLLVGLPQEVSSSLIITLVLYLVVDAVEKMTRFGMYDISGGVKMRKWQSCLTLSDEELDSSPCKASATDGIVYCIGSVGVLLLDFYCTRNFAVGMRSERQKLHSSVSLAERVVSALVRFDLEEAEQNIDNEDTTPLTEVLSQLLQNLRLYRPYLPDSLFELSEEDPSYGSHVKAPQGHVAILFTDLKSSTAIWEASPDAMKRALKTHDTIIRSCVADFGGYEVKTIGDSFMVAFQHLEESYQFAMAVQDAMISMTWPFELKLPTVFEECGWHGLMVRIGLHYGEVETEVNPVSGRTDYFGRVVNKAARLERACVPGGVAVESSLLSEVAMTGDWKRRTTYEHLKGIDDNPVCIEILYRGMDDRTSQSTHRTTETGSDFGGSDSAGSIRINGERMRNVIINERGSSNIEKLFSKRCATACGVQINTNMKCSLEQSGHVTESDLFNFQQQINDSLAKSISCLERTEGSIVAVLSCLITIGWNTTRNSSSHFENALRFVSLMYGAFSSPSKVFIGISSSPVQYGRVGTRDQRFVTVFGQCINMCSLLCQASCDIGAFALCANSPIEFSQRRPVDRWVVDNEETIIVYELQASKLREWLTAKVQEKEPTDDCVWGWGTDYGEAFDTRNWQLIAKNRCPRDVVLENVSLLLQKNRSLRPK